MAQGPDDDTRMDDQGDPASIIVVEADPKAIKEAADAECARKDKIVKTAKKRFKLCEEAEQESRKLAREDYEFRAGKHWLDQDITDRNLDSRPCLTINRIPQFIQQVTNDQRQNRPSIKIHPEDDQADIETAKILQGMIRHIENSSGADIAYDTAFDGAATGGFGFFRLITRFSDPMSFNQEFAFKRMRNPFAGYLDPSHQEPDGQDANYGFAWDDLQADDFKAQFPDAELTQSRDWESLLSIAPDWISKDSVRVVEYFDKVLVDDVLCEVTFVDGTTLNVLKSTMGEQLPRGAHSITDERPTKVPKVYWYKINGIEVLEESEWVCEWIPLIPVYGAEYIDPRTGRVIREGVCRHAKDPARMYNYMSSAEAEAIALAPKAPFVGAEGQFEGHEAEWKMANRRNLAFLEYKPKTVNGQLAPPPARQGAEPAVQAIVQAKQMAADDQKTTTGLFDPSMGAQKYDQSGVAIQRLNRQAQTGTFHLTDNLTRSIKHAARILAAGIPKVYDTKRKHRVIGEEGDERIVMLNAPWEDGGKPVKYDVTRGRYGVSVDTGPSFASKRQEAAASMMSILPNLPKLAEVAPDLIVGSMDWPGASEMAERLKRTLPPGLAQDSKQQPVPPQIVAQIQQQSALISKLTQELSSATEDIRTKRLELESKERIEMAKIQAGAELKLAELGSTEAMELLRQDIKQIDRRLQLIDWNTPIDSGLPNQAPGAMANGAASAGQPPGPMPTGGPPPG